MVGFLAIACVSMGLLGICYMAAIHEELKKISALLTEPTEVICVEELPCQDCLDPRHRVN